MPTSQPSLASLWANALPIPRPAPVTRATWLLGAPVVMLAGAGVGGGEVRPSSRARLSSRGRLLEGAGGQTPGNVALHAQVKRDWQYGEDQPGGDQLEQLYLPITYEGADT